MGSLKSVAGLTFDLENILWEFFLRGEGRLLFCFSRGCYFFVFLINILWDFFLGGVGVVTFLLSLFFLVDVCVCMF